MQPSIASFRSIVQRNRSRSPCRYLRARSFSAFSGREVWEDEQHLVDPSDDENTPAALPGVHLDLPDHFSRLLACMRPRVTVQSVKRPGDPLDMGYKKEQHTGTDPGESDLDAGAGDVGPDMGRGAPEVDLSAYGLPATSRDNRRLAISEENRKNGIDIPTAGWSSFTRMYSVGRPNPSKHAALRLGPFSLWIPRRPIIGNGERILYPWLLLPREPPRWICLHRGW